MLLAFYIVVYGSAYLLVGYGWAMFFIHTLTDGYWEHEGILRTHRTPMGVGTAVFCTTLWWLHMIVCVVMTIGWATGVLFSADMWKKVYRL